MHEQALACDLRDFEGSIGVKLPFYKMIGFRVILLKALFFRSEALANIFFCMVSKLIIPWLCGCMGTLKRFLNLITASVVKILSEILIMIKSFAFVKASAVLRTSMIFYYAMVEYVAMH
jgi:hypothetical protein